MPTPEIERAMADGAQRSRAAVRPRPAATAAGSRREAWEAFGTWLRVGARDFVQRHRKLLIGLGLFLLFDLIAAMAAVTMGTHF